MLYHNYVARQINPLRYETPYIGQKAVVEQLKLKEEKFLELTGLSSGLELSYLTKLEEALKETERDIKIISQQSLELAGARGQYVKEKEERKNKCPIYNKKLEPNKLRSRKNMRQPG